MPVILDTGGDQKGMVVVPDQPRQKVLETPSQQKRKTAIHSGHACHPSRFGKN
jgi:hypothetical protein